jgi:phosphotransferase system enzyme I (PtsP)
MKDFAKVSDFFSIGTNDFVQYLLGIDRTNEKVADLYLPHHPAVLRSLKRIADVCRKYKKDVSLCGEMAHHQRYIPFLLGIGIRSLSMDAVYLPMIQKLINNITIKDAEELAQRLLKKDTLADLAELCGFY